MSELDKSFIPFSKLKKIVEQNNHLPDDAPITFEFMCMLFPTIWDNIQKELNHQYTLGYIEGKKEQQI